MMGDQTLFTRADEVEAAWQVTPALSVWDAPDPASIPMKLVLGNLLKQNT